jgi:dihydrofolate reductase
VILSIIVAYATDSSGRYVIGKDNAIPWHDPQDLIRFREHTAGHAVIMGRKTFESIGKPLRGRFNIVITRQKEYAIPGAHLVHNLEDALNIVPADCSEVFIIGGQELYEQTIHKVDRLYITYIHEKSVEGDTFFPFWDRREFRFIHREGKDSRVDFEILQRVLKGEPNHDPRAGFADPRVMSYHSGEGI